MRNNILSRAFNSAVRCGMLALLILCFCRISAAAQEPPPESGTCRCPKIFGRLDNVTYSVGDGSGDVFMDSIAADDNFGGEDPPGTSVPEGPLCLRFSFMIWNTYGIGHPPYPCAISGYKVTIEGLDQLAHCATVPPGADPDLNFLTNCSGTLPHAPIARIPGTSTYASPQSFTVSAPIAVGAKSVQCLQLCGLLSSGADCPNLQLKIIIKPIFANGSTTNCQLCFIVKRFGTTTLQWIRDCNCCDLGTCNCQPGGGSGGSSGGSKLAEPGQGTIDPASATSIDIRTDYVSNICSVTGMREDDIRTVMIVATDGSIVRSISGNHTRRLDIPISTLASGVYVVNAVDNNGNTHSMKIVVKK
ncbi:MAG: hypothetical protein JWQ98_3707 [Chlorobi bacterium]|nr:hypothetical protein [Chlorobiota bacterium]